MNKVDKYRVSHDEQNLRFHLLRTEKEKIWLQCDHNDAVSAPSIAWRNEHCLSIGYIIV